MNDSLLARQQQLVEAQPASADARVGLAKLLMEAGRLPEAAVAMEQAIALRPGNLGPCLNNLGVIQFHLGRWDKAASCFAQAISLSANDFLAHNNLGDALDKIGHTEAAINSYKNALRLNPQFALARDRLVLALYALGRFREAIDQLHIAVGMHPRDGAAFTNLMLCHTRLAEPELALQAARRALEIEPDRPEIHSNLIALMNYLPWDDPAAILQESLNWDRLHGTRFSPPALMNTRDPQRQIRIAFISPDLKYHAVAFFLWPLLEHLNRERFFVACYAEVAKPDAMTERMKSSVDLWRDTVNLQHDTLAEQIRADGIDILIDLCGHLMDNRLVVLAQKPAPIQISWLGYPNTTGMRTVDYRLTDALADPPGSSDAFYSEKLVRLPTAFFVFDPPTNAGPVQPPPMLADGHVTFGSFNNLTKITPKVVDLWAELLQFIPSSRLLMIGLAGDRAQQARQMFRQRGIPDAQLETTGWMNFDDYLRAFNRVDIALDPFPWNGHTTTCHSLWMGVPVVSLAGPTALSRAGMSVMGNLEMAQEWVAQTPAEYLKLAQSWATKPNELAEIRTNLRQRMQRSPLLDAAGFTAGFENVLRDLWVRWCDLTETPDVHR